MKRAVQYVTICKIEQVNTSSSGDSIDGTKHILAGSLTSVRPVSRNLVKKKQKTFHMKLHTGDKPYICKSLNDARNTAQWGEPVQVYTLL